MKPSRRVTRVRCVVCDTKFAAQRKDARYCSGKCRQQAARSRAAGHEWQRRLDELRRAYWNTVREAAEARGVHVSRVVTEQAQLVTTDGRVYMGGSGGGLGDGARHVGYAKVDRPGWARHGLEAAGPPFSPPTGYFADHYEGLLADLYQREPVS